MRNRSDRLGKHYDRLFDGKCKRHDRLGGKVKREGRPVADGGSHRDLAVVLFDNAEDLRQAEPSPLVAFGAEEWFEDARLDLR